MIKPKFIKAYDPNEPLTDADMQVIKFKLGSPFVLKTDHCITLIKRAVQEGLITLTEDQKAWLAKVEA